MMLVTIICYSLEPIQRCLTV